MVFGDDHDPIGIILLCVTMVFISLIIGMAFHEIISPQSGKNIVNVTPNQSSDTKQSIHFASLSGVAASGRSCLAIDAGNRSISRFNETGSITLVIGGENSKTNPFRDISGVASDSFGNIYVTDAALCKVFVFDSTGALKKSWGSYGSKPGEFILPSGIVVIPGDLNTSESILVADKGNSRIQKYSPDGKFFGSIGDPNVVLPVALPVSPSIGISRPLNSIGYKPVIPNENATPRTSERRFEIQCKDEKIPITLTVDRTMYLGAKNNEIINIVYDDKTPEVYVPILSGVLTDNATASLERQISSSLQNASGANKLNEREKFDLICSFVQQIPFGNSTVKKYPVEVIHDKKGNSFDKALLLYDLLYHAGYDVMYLAYPGTAHAGLGVRIEKEIANPLIQQYTSNDKPYIYLNPDTPGYLGLLSPELKTIDPFILALRPAMKNESQPIRDIAFQVFIVESKTQLESKMKFLDTKIPSLKGDPLNKAKKDREKLKEVHQFIEKNSWNPEGVAMRIKNSKVLDIQMLY